MSDVRTAPRFGDHVNYVGHGVDEYVGLIVDIKDNRDFVVARNAYGKYTETPFAPSTLRAVSPPRD